MEFSLLAMVVVLALVTSSRGEQVCSVCCWEAEGSEKFGEAKTCRMCIHDQQTCPNQGALQEPASFYHPQAAAPPGRTVPNEFHAAPAPQFSNPPGSREQQLSEGLAGPPSRNAERSAIPGLKAVGIVLPEGPEDSETYLTFASRPGANPGPPAYGQAPAASAPGWTAHPPGGDPSLLVAPKELKTITTKSDAVAFSASITRRRRAVRRREIVTYDTMLTNFDSGADSRKKSFNPESGNFTCFVPGHYFFSINVKKIRGHHTLKLRLMKNEEVAWRVESSSYSDSISATSIVHLEKGDRVYLKLERRYSIDALSSFSGYLIFAD